ncbi:unnamed protein product, partial [Vitis vinifera]
MKKLIRRLSRVSDSSQYCLLRSDSRSATRTRRSESFRTAKLRLLEALRLGDESGDLQELVNSECL